MKNSTNDGIFCDYCGNEVKGDFIYYSLDFYEVALRRKLTNKSDSPALSADLCEKCMELLRQRLLDVNGKVPESRTRCDISGSDIGPVDQIFYECRISSVAVNISGQPHKCPKCGCERRLEDGPCDCGDGPSELICSADVGVDDEYLNLNFSAETFNKFSRHTKSLKDIGESEWTKN